jgi:hypothetical protein
VTVTFAGSNGQRNFVEADVYIQVATKHLDEGSYALVATADVETDTPFAGDKLTSYDCQIRNGTDFVGGSGTRLFTPEEQSVNTSISMNGGAFLAAGGGDVSLWCRSQDGSGRVSGQIMIMKVAGFF